LSPVRFGVATANALELQRAGVRSRRLTQAVESEYVSDSPDEPLREWLVRSDISQWRDRFDASQSELADLLAYARDRDAYVAARVLAGETVELTAESGATSGPVQLSHIDETAPPRIGIWRDGDLVGHVSAKYHEDLDRLLEVGVPLIVQLEAGFTEATIQIRAIAPETDPDWFADA
jgi:hypothetical protein